MADYHHRMRPISFKRHRFPPEIIRHAIWLYARFTLSFRDVEELLAERGIDASYETVRRWFLKFGPSIAANVRRSRPRPSDHWHLDEVVISIRGGKYWLWRAVDNEGEVHTNVICCVDDISRNFAPAPSAFGPRHPPAHDAWCLLHSPQLNADNVTKPLR
jgi:hypothetical protein